MIKPIVGDLRDGLSRAGILAPLTDVDPYLCFPLLGTLAAGERLMAPFAAAVEEVEDPSLTLFALRRLPNPFSLCLIVYVPLGEQREATMLHRKRVVKNKYHLLRQNLEALPTRYRFEDQGRTSDVWSVEQRTLRQRPCP